MATRKLYGNEWSENAMRVMVALHEKKLDYDDVHVDMFNLAHRQEPHLSRNPFAQVPTFEDGDLKLFESRAITNYIAHVYPNQGTPLVFPDDPKKMAIVSVWMEVEAHHFNPPTAKLLWELVLKSAFRSTNLSESDFGSFITDQAVVEENEAKLSKVLDVYEKRLGEFEYIGGDEFSLADLNHIPNIEYLKATRSWKLFESRTKVHAWCKAIMGRESWSKVVKMQEEKKMKYNTQYIAE